MAAKPINPNIFKENITLLNEKERDSLLFAQDDILTGEQSAIWGNAANAARAEGLIGEEATRQLFDKYLRA